MDSRKLLKLLHILSLRDGCFTSPEEVTENECLTKDSRPPATTSPRFRMHMHLRITSQNACAPQNHLTEKRISPAPASASPSCLSPENSGSRLKSPQQNYVSRDTFPFPHETAAQSFLFTRQSSGFACSGAILVRKHGDGTLGFRGYEDNSFPLHHAFRCFPNFPHGL